MLFLALYKTLSLLEVLISLISILKLFLIQVYEHPASLMDLLPTLADLADVELPKNLILDGKSLRKEIIEVDSKNDEKVEEDYDFDDLKPIFFYRGNALFNIRFF